MCGQSDHAPGHKDALQFHQAKSGNTHTTLTDWPWLFLQCCIELHWIVPPRCVEHHPILAPNGKRTDSTFTCRVVSRNLSITQEHAKLFFLVQAVSQAIASFCCQSATSSVLLPMRNKPLPKAQSPFGGGTGVLPLLHRSRHFHRASIVERLRLLRPT